MPEPKAPSLSSDPKAEDADFRQAIGRTLRAVRRHRKRKVGDIADAMGMPVRTYHNLEAGRGHPTLDTILRFASTTDTDPFAVIAAAFLNRPTLAIDCADNKYALISVYALGSLHRVLGPSLAMVSPQQAVQALAGLADQFTRTLEPDIVTPSDHAGDQSTPLPRDEVAPRAPSD